MTETLGTVATGGSVTEAVGTVATGGSVTETCTFASDDSVGGAPRAAAGPVPVAPGAAGTAWAAGARGAVRPL